MRKGSERATKELNYGEGYKDDTWELYFIPKAVVIGMSTRNTAADKTTTTATATATAN